MRGGEWRELRGGLGEGEGAGGRGDWGERRREERRMMKRRGEKRREERRMMKKRGGGHV